MYGPRDVIFLISKQRKTIAHHERSSLIEHDNQISNKLYTFSDCIVLLKCIKLVIQMMAQFASIQEFNKAMKNNRHFALKYKHNPYIINAYIKATRAEKVKNYVIEMYKY